MRNLFVVSALCLGVSVVGRADTTFYLVSNTYTYMDINGTNLPPPAVLTGTATGTVNIDTNAGVFDSVNIDLKVGSTDYIFTGAPDSQSAFDNNSQYFEYKFDSAGDSLTIDVPGGSLVGYTGGFLCSTDNFCDGYAGDLLLADGSTNYVTTSGSLAQTPEPSSVVLLGTGLLASLGAIRRRVSSYGK